LVSSPSPCSQLSWTSLQAVLNACRPWIPSTFTDSIGAPVCHCVWCATVIAFSSVMLEVGQQGGHCVRFLLVRQLFWQWSAAQFAVAKMFVHNIPNIRKSIKLICCCLFLVDTLLLFWCSV
jgi:hypothetical protein